MAEQLTECCQRRECWCGTVPARMDAMGKFAETEFGHSPFSARPYELSIIEGVADLKSRLTTAEAQLAEARRELVDYELLFELQYRRMCEATTLWRSESPAERELTSPDLGYLLQWLMERGDAKT